MSFDRSIATTDGLFAGKALPGRATFTELNATMTRASGVLQRAMDIVIALSALIVFLPLMIVVGLLVSVGDGGPVFFAHSRLGRNGRQFPCFKFRTMVTDSQARLEALLERDSSARLEWARDNKLKDDPRITRIGKFLRKSSLDELPQFMNVLRGEMSIVGPRPIVDSEVARYGWRFAHYCAVKPGITGLWQISGRNDVSYRRRVAMDSVYACRQSSSLYLHILILTVPCVLFARGSY